ncbi:carbohydrate-binding domain-containing protein [Candidatus Saccharibacteria bacterium]|nr:carbohydrate-binding domain-containing protein [Candidatus Saccharibacteria bacterium]
MTSRKNSEKLPIKDIVVIGIILAITLTAAIVVNINNTPSNTAELIEDSLDVDNGDQKINWTHYNTTDVELASSYQITTAGIYHFTGELEGGLIDIKVSKNDPVKLILDNVSIKNPSGPAILCHEADDLVIELIGDNYLIDGEEYTSAFDADTTGAIYSKADLTFEGDGTINISANYADGIVSKDDLKFNSGVYNITATDDAIRGKDSVYIVDGEFYIESVADGIKSTNETETRKGFILIESGSININSSGAKGLKAVNNILIQGGELNITSYDDAIHSNNRIGISNGNFTINASDDAIHANNELVIDNGIINIEKSYEGLEAQQVTINNGTIKITSIDDGINTGGGADSSANNRPGAGMFDIDKDCILNINGGYVYINASGDGLDSNGYIYINGGTIVVDGPTNNGNGALDAGAEIKMEGGEVIAIGSTGMAETLGENSSIYNISVYLDTIQPKDTIIEIKNSQDETVISHVSAKTFSHLAAGSNKFEQGETYTIYLNNEKYQDFTISNITTIIGNYTGPAMRRK